jgi:GNAT superfamily N-acetyltransferase
MVPELVRIRDREPADLDNCVEALAAVHQVGGYPTNWPADPARWLTPAGTVRAWVATTGDVPVAGHLILGQPPADAIGQGAAEVARLFVVPAARRQGIGRALLQQATHWATASDLDLVLDVTDHLRAARALYERAGFRLTGTRRADWTTPDGQPVTLHRYAWRREPGQRKEPAPPCPLRARSGGQSGGTAVTHGQAEMPAHLRRSRSRRRRRRSSKQ